MKVTFKCQHENANGDIVKLSTNAETLPELLEVFESFLYGCGFIFSGNVEITEDL